MSINTRKWIGHATELSVTSKLCTSYTIHTKGLNVNLFKDKTENQLIPFLNNRTRTTSLVGLFWLVRRFISEAVTGSCLYMPC